MTEDASDSVVQVLHHGSTEDVLWHVVHLHECSTAVYDWTEFN